MTAAISSQSLWYLARGSGVVMLVMLSATVVLGIATAQRAAAPSWPRFAVAELHRRIALMSVLFLGLHVATSVIDPYAGIGWLSTVAPFTSSYRPIWLGLGTLSLDVVFVVLASSLLRRRIGERTWRVLHWLAYASWPVALVHAVGTGTDVRLGWFQLIVALSVGAVATAGAWRLVHADRARRGARLLIAGGAGLVLLVGIAWARSGPLRPSPLSGQAVPAGAPAAGAHRARPSSTAAPTSRGGEHREPAEAGESAIAGADDGN
ncbi:MAG: ferric reductase-like transmembrane domain-containing protein [Actinomycetota bacterium]|nr:ferric reductase-like transmembrane domain-containing protein [Actinomycetota bacterium]